MANFGLLNNMPQDAEYWKNRLRYDPHSDWAKSGQDWIEEYWQSQDHLHRKLIIDTLREDVNYFVNILEIGCGPGPNLVLIRDQLRVSEKNLAGIDINKDVIVYGKKKMPLVDFRVGNLLKLPWQNKSFDCVLADASLMYIEPQAIEQAIKEIDRVCRKAIIIIDRFHPSLLGEETGHVWGRDYCTILNRRGFDVIQKKITLDIWPQSENWTKYGYLFLGFRPVLPIGKKN